MSDEKRKGGERVELSGEIVNELLDRLEEVVKKIEGMEKRISALERGKGTKRLEKETPKEHVIETPKLKAKVGKARKGVGITMKFPKFVKIVNNTAYIVLTNEEAVKFVKSLYKEVMNVVNGTNENRERKKVRIVEE